MNDLRHVIDRLYSEVQLEWHRRGGEPAAFPGAAAEALRRVAVHESINLDTVLDHVCSPAFEMIGGGTHPAAAIPLLKSATFNIYVHFWIDEVADLHSHQWGGAFTILDGESIHAVCSFEQRSVLHTDLRLGVVHHHGIERLRTGDVVEVEAGIGFVHGVAHIPRPSLSLSVRNSHGLSDLRVFYRHWGAAALAANADPPLLSNRLKALLPLCSTSPERFWDGLESLLAASDTASGFRALRRVQAMGVDGAELASRCRDWSAGRPDRQELVASLSLALRESRFSARWSELRDAELRTFLAIMLFAPTRRAVLQAVAELWACDDPQRQVAHCLAHADQLLGVGPEPLLGVVAQCAFDVDGDLDEVVRRLAAAPGLDGRQEVIRAMAAQIIESPFLSALFRAA